MTSTKEKLMAQIESQTVEISRLKTQIENLKNERDELYNDISEWKACYQQAINELNSVMCADY